MIDVKDISISKLEEDRYFEMSKSYLSLYYSARYNKKE